DCPFIVNTIAESVKQTGSKIAYHLHPILTYDGYRASLSYLEIEDISTEHSEVFIRRLKNALENLAFVTADFTSMLVRVETLAKVLQNKIASSSIPKSERLETSDFLRWLTDGGFIFVAYSCWDIKQKDLTINQANSFGLFKADQGLISELKSQIHDDLLRLNDSGELISINKINVESPVHRFVRLTHIAVVEPGASGQPAQIHSILGILTSKGNAQESSSIPLIRQKLKQVLLLENVIENSHDFKAIADIIDSMPKVEALRLNVDSLREIAHLVLEIKNKSETRTLIKIDEANRGALVLIAMPKEQYSNQIRDRLQAKIETTFGTSPGSCEYQVDLSSKNVMKIFFYTPLPEGDLPPIKVDHFQNELIKLSRNWLNNLEERIHSSELFDDKKAIWRKYSSAFPAEYQTLHSDEECLADIHEIETLDHQNSITVSFDFKGKEHFDIFTLSVYGYGKRTTISQAFPILENAGLEVIDERSSIVTPKGLPNIHIDRFLVRSKLSYKFTEESLNDFLAPGLKETFLGNVENDPLNSLMLSASLSTRKIALLRSYSSLLWQVNKFATRSVLITSLSDTPLASTTLWNMFEVKFDPSLKLSTKERLQKFDHLKVEFFSILQTVTDITKDRALRAISDLMNNTSRTNFYLELPFIAHKIQSEKVDIMPRPRPMCEIFVHAPDFEGTHLRTGKIARGGIRWSDRNEDYRSEVLGLVKTQKVKNSVIVPGGAKGGFVIRHAPNDDDSLKARVEDTYKKYIRALLSITDNRKGDKNIHPENVIVYDGEDPYLVVAADKGTATFSDIANKIAVNEFDFWLADAFASGGSNGYDHKVCAITAKGAWECAKRHFVDLGIDFVNSAFTAVGIGDMSGDVFGNGLLMSNKARLIAAFDHRHIFIDPKPDAARSFL
ncbi:MAG: NAD-glutamate dehydrogenase, partial [Bdellovibrionales bacterium]|nr:NAD-glutamate dehydrogenase [Bdellovibrionales bacterium]